MSGYILIMLWIGLAGILLSSESFYRIESLNGNGNNVYRLRPIYAFLVFLPLIIWCGYRGYIGDTGAYMRGFASMPSDFSGISEYFGGLTKDKGFYLGSALIKCIIGNNVNLYFIILALIQSYFLIKIYRKYSINFVISFFLFIASTDYISWMFNGIRQFVAVTIVFGCFDFILSKKYFFAIIGILIASLFHGTALIFIPFVFICQGEAWNKKTVIFIFVTALIIAFIGEFTNLLDNILQDTQYKNVVSDWQSWSDDGTNPLRVLVYSVPTIISLLFYKQIKLNENKVINICVNMSIVSSILYILSIFTSGIFIGRLPIYFSLYSYILLPWELNNLFDFKSKKILYILMYIFYTIFYLYSLSGLNLL